MKLSVLLLLLSLSQIGCDTTQSLPVFAIAGEQEQSEKLRLDSDETGRYLLEKPVVVTRADRAFYLQYRGGGSGGAVRILGKERTEIAAKSLPEAKEAVVYLPLERGQIIGGFQLVITPAGRLELLEVGIGEAVSGFKNTGSLLTVGTAVQGLERDGQAVRLAIEAPEEWQIAVVLETSPAFDYGDFRFRESLADLGDGSNLSESAVEPAVAPAAVPAVEAAVEAEAQPANRRTSFLLRLQSGESSATFRHSALPGRHSLFLYRGMVPFAPEALVIEPIGGAALWLESFEINRIPLEAAESHAGLKSGSPQPGPQPGSLQPGHQPGSQPGSLQPLSADPGALLLYDPQSWRQPDYELFAWSRFPQILIMDTATYAVQSRFFKRLAFFVEKRGYRGRMLRNEEFADLHGFNAHDYRAEDLARFFQAAREQLFALNPEEELLKQILLTNGIIRDEGVFSPGRGGILSISRSSYPLLRRHLLTHECAHGLFFSLPEFREASFEAWDRLSKEEKDFWRLFFRWVGYDTDDLYLTVNEYQAYLFQQPRSAVRYYFAVLTSSRLVSTYPGEASWVMELVRSDPDRFTRAFDDLESSLVRIAGVEGGRVIELESAESE
jgi:hypothetical protein